MALSKPANNSQPLDNNHSNENNSNNNHELSHEEEWSEVRETVSMVALAVAQIRCSLIESEKSIVQISSSFTDMRDRTKQLSDCISQMHQPQTQPEPPQDNQESTQHVVEEAANSLASDLNRVIMGFQYHDRLSQRLDHVTRDLELLHDLINSPDKMKDKSCWTSLKDDIRSSYTMESERLMFEHIMLGNSIEEALEIYHHQFSVNDVEMDADDLSPDDEVELF